MSLEGAIAAHRFGLGARPGEIGAASGNPRTWLESQLDAPVEQPDASALPGGALTASGAALTQRLENYRKLRRTDKDPAKAVAQYKEGRELYVREMAARFSPWLPVASTTT